MVALNGWIRAMAASERAQSRDRICIVFGCTWYLVLVLGAESSGGEIWENISTPARQPDCTHSCVLQKKTFATKHDTTDFLHENISISSTGQTSTHFTKQS